MVFGLVGLGLGVVHGGGWLLLLFAWQCCVTEKILPPLGVGAFFLFFHAFGVGHVGFLPHKKNLPWPYTRF